MPYDDRVLANVVLFFLGLGFTGLGAVNVGTAPLWFGLAAIFIGLAIIRTNTVRTGLSGALAWAARVIGDTAQPVDSQPNAEASDSNTLRQERDAALRERDSLSQQHQRGWMMADLDPGIAPVVVLLQEAGVETFESCQGGPGHSYPGPTVRFYGDRSEGMRALGVVLGKYDLVVLDLSRVWMVNDGEPTGPYWQLAFQGVTDRPAGTPCSEEARQYPKPGTPVRCCSRCCTECCERR